MKRPPGAPKGAQRHVKDGRDTFVKFRCNSALKARFQEAAGDGNLSDWMIDAGRKHLRETRPDLASRVE